MKSVLFLVAFSFCAVCGIFAEDAVEPQPTLIEETQILATEKCEPILACNGCQKLAGCSCKDKDVSFIVECGCKNKPKPPVEEPVPGLVCECQALETEEASA